MAMSTSWLNVYALGALTCEIPLGLENVARVLHLKCLAPLYDFSLDTCSSGDLHHHRLRFMIDRIATRTCLHPQPSRLCSSCSLSAAPGRRLPVTGSSSGSSACVRPRPPREMLLLRHVEFFRDTSENKRSAIVGASETNGKIGLRFHESGQASSSSDDPQQQQTC